VEGQIGWFRRNHLVPLPEVDSRAELNSMVERWDAENDDRRIRQRPRAVGEYFAVERPLLQPLPDEPFETGRLFSLRVDRYAQVSVRTNRYSVPVGLIGRTVRVMLYASEVVVYNGRKEVARHERLTAKGQSRLGLDHYLEALVRKPGLSPARPRWNRPAPQASSLRPRCVMGSPWRTRRCHTGVTGIRSRSSRPVYGRTTRPPLQALTRPQPVNLPPT
jgi:hypothetical protein